jgi:hypothetical protein
MADLVVVVPSRGRPKAAHELRDAFEATCVLDTKLVFAIDLRDAEGIYEYPFDDRATTWWSESTTMVEALNMRVHELLNGDMDEGLVSPPFAVGFMGDDHRPRIRGWDEQYVDTLRELGTGIVYGDDLLQGRRLPTQCAMTSDIVRALGYMAPPSLTHMYVDNFWLALGEQAQCIKYLPEVVVEHRHPVAGKAQWDEGYKRVNDPGVFAKDEAAFAEYCRTSLLGDVQKVQALRGAAVA